MNYTPVHHPPAGASRRRARATRRARLRERRYVIAHVVEDPCSLYRQCLGSRRLWDEVER